MKYNQMPWKCLSIILQCAFPRLKTFLIFLTCRGGSAVYCAQYTALPHLHVRKIKNVKILMWL